MIEALADQGLNIEPLIETWAPEPGDFSHLANFLLVPPGDPADLDSLADAFGTDRDFVHRAWQRLGLDEEMITKGDAVVVEMCAASEAVLGEASAMHLLSVVGQANRRLAEAEVAEIRLQRELPIRAADSGGPGAAYADEIRQLAEGYLPLFEQASAVIHRRHLMASGSQVWGTDASATTTVCHRLIGFTDLAGFTATSSALGLGELSHLVRVFESTVAEIVNGHKGRVVKLIGDEVMFSAESVEQGCDIAVALRESFVDQGLPTHSGLAQGDVVDHGGDYFGPVVNLASRLASVAGADDIVVGPGIDRMAPSHEFEQLEPLDVRGFDEPQRCTRLI